MPIVGEVVIQNHRAKVADCSFIRAGVERDFGAKIRAVNHTRMILRAAHVAGILESNPWVTSLKDQLEHFFPEINRRYTLSVHLTGINLGLVGKVTFLEFLSIGR